MGNKPESVHLDNESKPWSRFVPFCRVGSRLWDPKRAQADGVGLTCGCRNPDDDYEPTFVAAMLITGLLDAAGKAVPIPADLKNAANQVLKPATGKDFDQQLEDFKKKLADFLGKTAEGFLFKSALRMVPSWVPVGRRVDKKKKTMDKDFKEVDQEFQGTLSRSFQSCLDSPLFPWQRFANWNFHVRADADSGFRYVIGRGNVLNQSEISALGGVLFTGSLRPAFDADVGNGPFDNLLECVWDTGAFSRTPGNTHQPDRLPGVMFQARWPFWPMAGDRLWAQGRWVYDCEHVVEAVDKATGQTTEMNWTQIHPCRAIAAYRYEGVAFEKGEKAIPASRFLFFATVKGGYKDFGKFGALDPADDPQFLVDLPPPPGGASATWTIGASPNFAVNTVVIRPRLRIKLEFAPFGIPGTEYADDLFTFSQLEPKIEPIKSKKELQVPDQVRITFPLSKVDKDAYGVVVNLGWEDATGEQAARTKKVTVRFDELRDLKKSGTLRVKLCANGHWAFKAVSGASKVTSLGVTLPPFFLPDDARLVLSAHGQERHGMGEFLEENTERERQLRVGGLFGIGSKELEEKIKQGQQVVQILVDSKVVNIGTQELKKLMEIAGEVLKERRDVQWDRDVDQPDNAVASAVARETFFKPFSLFNRRDAPTGLSDRNHPFQFQTGVEEPGTPGDVPNRGYDGHEMSKLLEEQKASGKKEHRFGLIGRITEIAGDARFLGYEAPQLLDKDPDQRDYLLNVTVTIDDQ